jgi:PadR family transcriptional regulator PadR
MPRSFGPTTVEILRAIADGVRYGLDIMERTGLPSGTVYPALGRLEKGGYVSARWEGAAVARAEGRPRRRYYRLTGAGVRALREAIRRYGEIAARGVPGEVPAPGASGERAAGEA